VDQMRIDPKGTIAGYPAVDVRDALRRLRVRAEWDIKALEGAVMPHLLVCFAIIWSLILSYVAWGMIFFCTS